MQVTTSSALRIKEESVPELLQYIIRNVQLSKNYKTQKEIGTTCDLTQSGRGDW
jgi:hypothetical protein